MNDRHNFFVVHGKGGGGTSWRIIIRSLRIEFQTYLTELQLPNFSVTPPPISQILHCNERRSE